MIALRLLGSIDLRDEHGEPIDAVLRRPKLLALLAYLAIARPRGFHRRDKLVAMFWPESSQERARHALRQAIYALRREVGEDAIHTRGEEEVAVNTNLVASDVAAFEADVERGELTVALSHYRGDFLSGLLVSDAPEFERWADGERDRLGRFHRRVMEELAERATQAGDRLAAASRWRQVSEQDPYSTRVAIRLMQALEAAGDRAGALQYAERHAARMRQELGAEPAPDVVALAERLRAEPVPNQWAPDQLERLRTVLAGRYTIHREIGRGGMATVYLAEDPKHHRNVAVKVLRPELAALLGPQRFLTEIEVTAGLQHPNILPLFDSGEAEGFLYYVMPYVDGESLRARLTREPQLPIDYAVGIAMTLAEALDYAHRHGVVHRDIKPENILLHDGRPMVADFGIALAVSTVGGERLTETGLSLGTPEYMSPEQTTGVGPLDGRSDIYSLGCVVYEMLVGDPPFTGTNPSAILARKVLESPPRLRTVRSTVSVELEQVVMHALEKVPADRYANARAFAEALAAPPTAQRISTLNVKRLASAAAGVAGVVALTWILTTTLRNTEVLRSVAVLPCDNLSPDPDREYLSGRWTEELILKLSTVSDLRVKPWISVGRFKRTDKTAQEIAAEVAAGSLVRCRVAESDDSVQVGVQLIEAGNDRIIWANEYARGLAATSINDIQTDVARRIVEALGADLSPEEGARLGRPPTENLEAWGLYRRGRELNEMLSIESLPRSIDYFRQAIALDSSFALAYVGMAEATMWQQDGQASEARTVLPEVGRLARTALQIDETIPEGHSLMAAYLLNYAWDWLTAEHHHQRAIQLNPNSPKARIFYALDLSTVGRYEEALAQCSLAVRLDPSNPFFQAQLALNLYVARRYYDALVEAQKAIELDPRLPFAYVVLGNANKGLGRLVAAIAAQERADQLYGGFPAARAGLGHTYALAGMQAKAEDILDEFSTSSHDGYVDPVLFALVHVGLGNKDEAFRRLEEAYQHRSWGLVAALGLWPWYDSVRDDPRFQDLRRRVGFEEW